MIRLLVLVAVACALSLLPAPQAEAGCGTGERTSLTKTLTTTRIAACGQKPPPKSPRKGSSTSSGGSSRPRFEYIPKDDYKKAVAAQNARVAAYKHYLNASNAWNVCIDRSNGTACARPNRVELPTELNVRPAGDPKKPTPAAPAVTPEQAAYIAVARLHLTPPRPAIGPPPEINEWKMAAVGYPMWLWAEGNLNPAPVSDTVYDLTVSLDAHLAGATFDLGDGHHLTCTDLTCTDLTHRWVRGIAPAAPSPSCGYTYTQPSLPKGTYTITATSDWAVDWAVNGQGGTIHLYQQASTQLPVGELQVLVR